MVAQSRCHMLNHGIFSAVFVCRPTTILFARVVVCVTQHPVSCVVFLTVLDRSWQSLKTFLLTHFVVKRKERGHSKMPPEQGPQTANSTASRHDRLHYQPWSMIFHQLISLGGNAGD